MICPKCGTEQPDSAECVRCGVLVAQYRGPALGAAAFRPSGAPQPPAGGEMARPPLPPPPPPPPAGRSAEGTSYGAPPLPAAAALAPGAFKGTFSAGEILGETFSIYFSNLLPFALLAALALSPIYLLQYLVITLSPVSAVVSTSLYILVLILVLLAPQIATAAITFGVFQQMRGQEHLGGRMPDARGLPAPAGARARRRAGPGDRSRLGGLHRPRDHRRGAAGRCRSPPR